MKIFRMNSSTHMWCVSNVQAAEVLSTTVAYVVVKLFGVW